MLFTSKHRARTRDTSASCPYKIHTTYSWNVALEGDAKLQHLWKTVQHYARPPLGRRRCRLRCRHARRRLQLGHLGLLARRRLRCLGCAPLGLLGLDRRRRLRRLRYRHACQRLQLGQLGLLVRRLHCLGCVPIDLLGVDQRRRLRHHRRHPPLLRHPAPGAAGATVGVITTVFTSTLASPNSTTVPLVTTCASFAARIRPSPASIRRVPFTLPASITTTFQLPPSASCKRSSA